MTSEIGNNGAVGSGTGYAPMNTIYTIPPFLQQVEMAQLARKQLITPKQAQDQSLCTNFLAAVKSCLEVFNPTGVTGRGMR